MLVAVERKIDMKGRGKTERDKERGREGKGVGGEGGKEERRRWSEAKRKKVRVRVREGTRKMSYNVERKESKGHRIMAPSAREYCGKNHRHLSSKTAELR